jgi:hypothetical protein
MGSVADKRGASQADDSHSHDLADTHGHDHHAHAHAPRLASSGAQQGAAVSWAGECAARPNKFVEMVMVNEYTEYECASRRVEPLDQPRSAPRVHRDEHGCDLQHHAGEWRARVRASAV